MVRLLFEEDINAGIKVSGTYSKGLAIFDLPDVYRQLYGYKEKEFSWYWHGGERSIGCRFDHIFASRA